MEDICPHCGHKHTIKELDRDAGQFCIKCGTDMVTPPSPKNREGKEIPTSDIEKIKWLLGKACKDLVITSVMEYCDVLEGIDKASQKIVEVVALAENMEEGDLNVRVTLNIKAVDDMYAESPDEPQCETGPDNKGNCPYFPSYPTSCQKVREDHECPAEDTDPNRWACEDCGADQGEFKRNPTTNYPKYPGNCTECGGHVGYAEPPDGEPVPRPRLYAADTEEGETPYSFPPEEPKIPSDEYFAEAKRHEMELMGGAPEHLMDRAVPSIQKMMNETKESEKEDE